MAIKEYIEGTWSRKYDYVEICRDDFLVEEDLNGEKKKIWRKHITIIYNRLTIN